MEDAADHKVKTITVSPGRRLSYQRHQHRAEHWFVVRGVGLVTLDGKEITVEAGSTIDIPMQSAHRVSNTGTEELLLIEVQHGRSFAEDDIERLEDDFGRADS